MSIREKLAALEHDQWAHWTKYMLHVGGFLDYQGGCKWCGANPCKEHTGEGCAAGRWRRQIQTDYADLSEQEKNSDREYADKVLHLLRSEGWVGPD